MGDARQTELGGLPEALNEIMKPMGLIGPPHSETKK
jgi:hypothetical protein